jgi:hypothetical protein
VDIAGLVSIGIHYQRNIELTENLPVGELQPVSRFIRQFTHSLFLQLQNFVRLKYDVPNSIVEVSS